MMCNDFEKLMKYLDGELQGRELQEMEAHIRSCQDCRRLINSQRKLESVWRDDFEYPEEERFRTLEFNLMKRYRRRSAWKNLVPVAAGIIAVLIGVKLIVGNGPGTERIDSVMHRQNMYQESSAVSGEESQVSTDTGRYFGADSSRMDSAAGPEENDGSCETEEMVFDEVTQVYGDETAADSGMTARGFSQTADGSGMGTSEQSSGIVGIAGGTAQEEQDITIEEGSGGDIQLQPQFQSQSSGGLGHVSGDEVSETPAESLVEGQAASPGMVEFGYLPEACSDSEAVAKDYQREALQLSECEEEELTQSGITMEDTGNTETVTTAALDQSEPESAADQSDDLEDADSCPVMAPLENLSQEIQQDRWVRLTFDSQGLPDSTTAALLDSLSPRWRDYIPFEFRDTVLVVSLWRVEDLITPGHCATIQADQ